MKKIFLTAAAVAMTATAASAAEIGSTGINIGAELDNRYNFDAENFSITLSPEVGYEKWGFGFEASSDIMILDDESFVVGDELPTIDLSAEYGLTTFGLTSTAYVETGFDLENEDMTDIEAGIKLAF